MTKEERNQLIYDELGPEPERFIWSVIRKKGYARAIDDWNFMDEDDLVQEGWISLMQAANNFNEEYEKDFAWYAFYWVNQRLGMVVDNNIDKNKHETYISKDMEIEDEEDVNIRFREFLNQLEDRDEEIVKLSVEGYTQEEIGEMLDIDQQVVSYRLNTLHNRLE